MGAKKNEATNAQKLLKLYVMLLLAERPLSRNELMTALDVSNQSMGRLLASLTEIMDSADNRGYGFITKEKHHRNSYFSLTRPKGKISMPLTPEGLNQMELCRAFMSHLLPKDDLDMIKDAIARAKTHFSSAKKNEQYIAECVVKGSIDYTPHQKTLKILRQAMLSRTCCIVSYKKSIFEEKKNLCILPQKLIAFHETLNVTGWRVTEKGQVMILDTASPINLSVHRIVGIEEQKGRTGENLPEVSIADNREFGYMKQESFKCRIRFTEAVATYVAERTWSDDQTVTLLDDRSIILEFTARSKLEVKSFVLGYGVNATVLEPLDLRQMVSDELKLAAQNYQNL